MTSEELEARADRIARRNEIVAAGHGQKLLLLVYKCFFGIYTTAFYAIIFYTKVSSPASPGDRRALFGLDGGDVGTRGELGVRVVGVFGILDETGTCSVEEPFGLIHRAVLFDSVDISL